MPNLLELMFLLRKLHFYCIKTCLLFSLVKLVCQHKSVQGKQVGGGHVKWSFTLDE